MTLVNAIYFSFEGAESKNKIAFMIACVCILGIITFLALLLANIFKGLKLSVVTLFKGNCLKMKKSNNSTNNSEFSFTDNTISNIL